MPSRPVTALFDPTKDSPITTTTWTSLQAQSKNQRKTDTNEPGSGPEMENPPDTSRCRKRDLGIRPWELMYRRPTETSGVRTTQEQLPGCTNAAERRRPTGQRLFPTILLHFHHPWRSDVGRYDSREGGGRVAPGAATESTAGAIAEKCGSGDLRRA
jgi:hypothetical protein